MRTYTTTEYEMSDYDEYNENLTNDEAANILEYIKRGYIPDYNFTMDEDDFEHYKLHMALTLAIKSLRRSEQ